MANEEQVTLLKKSVKEWNQWRDENPRVEIDLSLANLDGANLRAANLVEADLMGVHLTAADLRLADLMRANLKGASLGLANLREANLRGADLMRANLRGASLGVADLRGANLRGADLIRVDLRDADLREANLMRADLPEAKLTGTKWKGAFFNSTNLANVDLSLAEGLEDVIHTGPSYIDIRTLQRSKGKIPEQFLRGCDLSDWEIESAKLYQEGLSAQEGDDILYRIRNLRFGSTLQINPLFISYHHADGAFVDAMEKILDKKGIRFWRDVHDASVGPLEKIVDRAMRQNPTVLLVLSEKSVDSPWVEYEVQQAKGLEEQLGRPVLYPVALDDAWENIKWPEQLRVQIMKYNILDFSKWNDEEIFENKFERLVDGLVGLHYRDEPDEFHRKGSGQSKFDWGTGTQSASLEDHNKIQNPDQQQTSHIEGLEQTYSFSLKRPGSNDQQVVIKVFDDRPADNVHFAVTTLPEVLAGSHFNLAFWMHLEEQREKMIGRAKEELGADKILANSEGPVKVERGMELTVVVNIEGMKVDPPQKNILWSGEISKAGFTCYVPKDAEAGLHPGKAVVYLKGMQIAQVCFIIEVGNAAAGVETLPVDVKLIQKAFASYASKDRVQVLGRIQGMQKILPNLEVFVDVVSLRSGQDWEHELWKVIPTYDVFYLFWSKYARNSPWVEKEWRCALDKRGLDYIDPVPLVSPTEAPPPPELASKHFNDWMLPYIRVEEEK